MALPVQSFVWPRLRHVVGLWVARETALPTASILWDDQNQPSPGQPYIGLRRRSFPLGEGAGFPSESITEHVQAVTATVTATTAGETASLLLFGNRYAYTLVGGDTTTDARDALLALIAPDLLRTIDRVSGEGTALSTAVGFQPCTAVANGADAIDFAGFGVGPVRVEAVENITLGSQTLAFLHTSAGLRRAVVRVDLFFPEQQSGFELIDEYVDALRSSLLEEGTAQFLRERGVGVEQAARINAQDASVTSGGTRQRREFFDVIFNARAKRYRLPTPIDSAVAPTIELIG